MNRDHIVQLLQENDRAVARALVALTERQTSDEKASKNTRYRNGRGFRPCHARMGTSMAEFFRRNGYLTPNQLAYWREPQRDGRTRIEIYANQLLSVAQERATAPRPAARPEPSCDMEAELSKIEVRRPEPQPEASMDSVLADLDWRMSELRRVGVVA